ncbi:MAG TPA: hypothetical protein VI864_02615 [Candidatus Bathyarchaeia archaeon]|nr:hypothetical protein [Candidatus Bathyarchaeia archaeon]
MNLRGFVVLVYVAAFLVALFGVFSIPVQAWQNIENWQKAMFAFYILVGFCGILIACWVYEDGQQTERLETFYYSLEKALEKRIYELEKKTKTLN